MIKTLSKEKGDFAMSTKNDFLKEADELKKQADQYRQRREVLKGKITDAEKDIKNRSDEIAAALLDDKDTSILSSRLTGARVDLEGLQGAISEADRRINDIEDQRKEALMKARATEFFAADADIHPDIINVISDIRLTVEKIKAIEGKYNDLQKIGPLALGRDQTETMYKVFENLRNVFVSQGASSVDWQIKNIEHSFAPYLAKAREKIK